MSLQIAPYLQAVVVNNGSDLHIKVGSLPKIRISGSLVPLQVDPLTAEGAEALIRETMPPDAQQQLPRDQRGRLRARRARASAGSGSTRSARAGPPAACCGWSATSPMSLERPRHARRDPPAGPRAPRAGAGHRPHRLGQDHHAGGDGRRGQRAAARCTSSPSRTRSRSSTTTSWPASTSASSAPTPPTGRSALRAAMRQDPDVILIGEMRDAETVKAGAVGRRDRPLRDVDAAHHRRQGDREPDHRLLPAARAEAGPPRAGHLAARHRLPAAGAAGPTARAARWPWRSRSTTRGWPRRSPTPSKTDTIDDIVAAGGYSGMQTFDQHLVAAGARRHGLGPGREAGTAPTPTTSRSCSSAPGSTRRSSTPRAE